MIKKTLSISAILIIYTFPLISQDLFFGFQQSPRALTYTYNFGKGFEIVECPDLPQFFNIDAFSPFGYPYNFVQSFNDPSNIKISSVKLDLQTCKLDTLFDFNRSFNISYMGRNIGYDYLNRFYYNVGTFERVPNFPLACLLSLEYRGYHKKYHRVIWYLQFRSQRHQWLYWKNHKDHPCIPKNRCQLDRLTFHILRPKTKY